MNGESMGLSAVLRVADQDFPHTSPSTGTNPEISLAYFSEDVHCLLYAALGS